MSSEFLAIYFRMGMYNEDDGVPELIVFDCPFDDSPVLRAESLDGLEEKVRGGFGRGLWSAE